MAIINNDIKMFQAQDNSDNDNGGGSRTSVEIEDGGVNNLFPDISRIDTVSGDVSLRKVFPTVYTTNRDIYYGAHSIIRKTPTDSKVSALLFHTDDPHDQRIDAQDKIESYVVASYLEQFYLFGNHVIGAKAVTFLQTLDSQLPDVANTYLLKEGDVEQYIRIEDIDAQEVTLYYSHGDTEPTPYVRRRVICTIDQPLFFAFTGSDFHPAGQEENTADTYATQVANAAKYYGTKSIASPSLIGDTSVNVDSIYEQLVPASKKQTPIINEEPLVSNKLLIPAGASERNITLSGVTLDVGQSFVFPDIIEPNSLLIQGTFEDDGNGLIVNKSDGEICGSIDYKTSTIFATKYMTSNNSSFKYKPAILAPTITSFTNKVTITQENQGLVFVRNLSPSPAVGELMIDYRSQGKWYRFTSNNDNTLGDDSGIGAGTIFNNNDGTSSISMTLGSLPDLDSTLVVTWGSGLRLNNRKSESLNLVMRANIGVSDINPDTFNMSVFSPAHGSHKTITCDSGGKLIDEVGVIQGSLNFVNGIISIYNHDNIDRFDDPNSGNIITINVNENVDPPTTTSLTRPFYAESDVDRTVSFNIGTTVIQNSVTVNMGITFTTYSDKTTHKNVVLNFDTSGNVVSNDSGVTGSVTSAGIVSLTLPLHGLVERDFAYGGSFGFNSRYIDGVVHWKVTDTPVVIGYKTAGATYGTLTTINKTIEELFHYEVDLPANVVNHSTFQLLDNTDSNYVKMKNNVVYNEIIGSGAGVNIGTFNDETNIATLTYFSKPLNFVQTPIVVFSDDIGDINDKIPNVVFKTASTKLTTSSFQMRYENENGQHLLTTDGNGNVTGTDVDGTESYVDTSTGLASIIFTTDVDPTSIKYDAVAETSLPLDPDLLGLNPVRLPSDGRVPIYDNGRHLVIFNEVSTDAGTPTANQTINLARSGQSYIEVVDADGKRLNPTEYTVDKNAGTVVFSDPLVLEDKYNNALTAPFSVVDRVEDMVLATNVQINGKIELSASLTHDYPVLGTKVASALVWGNIGSRVFNLFSQEIWDAGNPEWSDDLIGDGTNGQYDDTNYPVQIDNKSSVSGRWAIVFKSSTSVDVIEEKLGVVEQSVSISISDVAPINPATGEPYFTMDKDGFGGGWVTNNVVRLNTDSGDANQWVVRTVQSGALSELTDSIEIETRGDAN